MATHLIEGLRSEGEVDSVGRFTLDPVKAREKLQKFQLVDAHRYVLELVQAAVLRGATEIAFDIDADDMHMRFDGAVFTAEELGDVWGSIFADGEERLLRGVRQLALGLNAALGLGPKRIVVRSGDQELRLAPGAADVHRAVAPALAGTTIHVAQRVKLAGLGLFFKNLVGSLAEEVHLRERCVYATQAITLDGTKISRGFTIADALGADEIAAPGVRGLVAVTKGAGAAELRLIKDGVWIDSRELEGCGPGVLALVEGEGLRKDVSLAKIVADETLAAVLVQVQAARWSAMARLLELSRSLEGIGRNHEKRVRAEVLRSWVPTDLASGPDATIVAEGMIWHEARAHNPEKIKGHGRLTLLDVAAAVVPATEDGPATLRFAERMYNQLTASGLAIPYVHEDERAALARMLGCTLVPADELERLARREKARREFLQRTSTGRLPDRGYAIFEPFAGEGVRGELGILLSPGSGRPAQETTWLCREGCVLTALKLDWGIPGVDVAVEAGFEPTDEYDDAVRDRVVVDAALCVLAGLQGLLERLSASQDITIAATARGIIKAWLLLVLDEETRAALWQRLKVPKKLWPDERAVRAMLPGPDRLLESALQRTPLFEDFDGARRSLDDLEWRLKKQGQLDELERSHAHMQGLGSEVLYLGRGDRAILVGLFGAKALRSYLPILTARRNEQAFFARPTEQVGAAARRLRTSLPSVAGDSSLWCRTFDGDGVRGVVVLARNKSVPTAKEGLREATIDLYIGERKIVTRRIDVGLGPISAAAYCEQLRATVGWDDVEADEGLTRVVEAVGRAAWSLLVEVLRSVPDEDRWVAQLVVRRLMLADRDEVTARAPELTAAPLVGTITGERVSLDTIEAALRKHGKIGWVLASTADAAISDPPVLRDKRGLIDVLRDLVGPDCLVEGDLRVRQRELGARLDALPKIAAVRLDPQLAWRPVTLDSGSPKLEGEIGLSRRRTSGGLQLTLCTQGRFVGATEDASFEVACEAIVSDPQMPLTAGAEVDTRNKRYGQYLKRCRRAIHGLVVGLCEQYAELAEAERGQARALLLRFVGAERKVDVRREARQAAWSAALELPLLVDVWGREHTLAEVEARMKGGAALEVVKTQVNPPPGTQGVERPILRVDAAGEVGLAGLGRLVVLDHRWAEVSAELLAMAASPDFVMPDLRAEAWIDRNATLAGGLQAHLWIPRRPAETDALVFTRGNKVVGRLVVFEGVSCAGVIRGDGLVVEAEGVTLDERQRVSLGKQVCMLIESLARQLKQTGGRVKSEERGLARSWLVTVAGLLEQLDPERQKELGKPYTQMCAALEGFASPTMRKARVGKPPAAMKAPEGKAPEVAAVAEVKAPEVAEVKAPVAPAKVEVWTPEQALLAAVRAELVWARERHGSLHERLRLDRLAIGSGKPGIVAFAGAIELQRRHPLIARQLVRLERGEGVDPVDLMFVVSAVYTLMNAVSEEIVASDEQAFVARVAEGLALALA